MDSAEIIAFNLCVFLVIAIACVLAVRYARKLLKLIVIGVFGYYLIFGILLGKSSDIIRRLSERLFEPHKIEHTANSREGGISDWQAAAILNGMTILKPGIVDYYRSHDRLPRPIDLPVHSAQNANIHLLDNGTVEVLVEGERQPMVYWRFTPRADGYQGWECVSPNITNLEWYFPDCHYDPSYDKSKPVTQEIQVNDHINFNFGSLTTYQFTCALAKNLI